MYDVAIVGSGPAAISAALNLQIYNKSIIWFGSAALSGKVEKSEKIANYPGFLPASGYELNQLFLTQIHEAGLEIIEKMVTTITVSRRCYMIQGGNELYETKSVLLATGAANGAGFPGEEALLGHGVSYCATCDGFLYQGKRIAVYCGDLRFVHEVKYLADMAETLYLFAAPKVEPIIHPHVIIEKARIQTINGSDRVESLTLTDGTALPIDGVFILRNAVAPSVLMRGLEMDGPHIRTDRGMRTSKKGCFAAGDCTGRPYQIAKAVGEGNIAAHSIIEYLAEISA